MKNSFLKEMQDRGYQIKHKLDKLGKFVIKTTSDTSVLIALPKVFS